MKWISWPVAICSLATLSGCLSDWHAVGSARLKNSSRVLDSSGEPSTSAQLVVDKPTSWFRRKISKEKPEAISRREANISVRKVSLDGQAVLLGQDDEPAMTTAQFTERVRNLLAAQRHLSAVDFVRRFPEISQCVLQEGLVAEKSDMVLLSVIAQAHDEHSKSADGAWQRAIDELKAQPSRFAEYAAARREVHSALTTGQAVPRTRPLPDLLPGQCSPAWRIDAWSLTGMLRMLEERNREAGQAFAQAVDMGRTSQPYAAMQAELLLAESVRRDEFSDAAAGFWQSSVKRAALLMTGRTGLNSGIVDPQFWARAAYLHPNQAEWPAEATRAFDAFHTHRDWPELNESPECLLWSLIGHARLERHDAQGALVAFKKSESLARSSTNADRWQIAQAKALVGLGQSAAATALLMKHTQHQDPGISQPALALLGTIKLQTSQATVGLALLRKAHETFPDAIWPGQLEARADLGLACLMCGDETAGLRELHSVQKLFEQRGDAGQLLKLLNNEAAWHDARKQRSESDSVRTLITQVEASFAPQP